MNKNLNENKNSSLIFGNSVFMKKYIKNILFTEKSVPCFLLIACILAFGLLTPKLGYFQDDWNYVFNSYVFGHEGIKDFLNHDGRPYAAWFYNFGFNVFGYAPLAWHIAILIFRWLTAVVFWKIFELLWPKNSLLNFTATLIFVIYPFFTLQPLAVAYGLHWTGYLLLGVSILFMLKAQRERFWLFTILALLTQISHLLTLEYYAGIEFLRPILLWIVFSSAEPSLWKKLIRTLKIWAPYLLVFILYFVWRGFFYQAATEGRNIPVGLIALMQNPIATILTDINNAISDVALILITSWYKLLTPEYLDFSVSENRMILAISLIGFSLFMFYFVQQKKHEELENKSVARQMFFVGFAAFLFGLLPSYAANFIMHQKIEPWNTRFSLGSLFGAALIVTVAIENIVKVPRTRWIIIATLTGLLIGWHLHYTNDFRWAWDKQVNFYRQLYLRAPEITPNTALVSEEEFLMYMGDYPTSYAINLIYATKGDSFEGTRRADYWFFPLIEFYNNMEQHINGEPFSKTRAGLIFEGDPEGSIVISFEPELGQCLWVIRPEYASSKALSQTTRQLASISYVDRIRQAPENPDSFLLKYLYTNPKQDWCYYYEKADLAYQYEEWDNVIQLWQSAKQSDLRPENGFEYLPFIEAYAHADDWGAAKKLTLTSQITMQGIDPLLCTVWNKLDNNTPASTEKENALTSVKDELRCE